MAQISICAECKHSKHVDNVFLEYTCEAPWPQETNFVTGRKTTPFANWSCDQNKGQCPGYRNKDTGLPLPEPRQSQYGEMFVIFTIPIITLLIVGALIWSYSQ